MIGFNQKWEIKSFRINLILNQVNDFICGKDRVTAIRFIFFCEIIKILNSIYEYQILRSEGR